MTARSSGAGGSAVGLLVGAVFLVAGIMVLFLGIGAAIDEHRFRAEGRLASGMVIGKSIERAGRDDNSTTRYQIAYHFETAAGELVAGQGEVPLAVWEQLAEGAPVEVQYVAGAPERNRLAGASGLGDTIVMLVLGTLVPAAGGALFWWQGRAFWRTRVDRRARSVLEAEVRRIEAGGRDADGVRQQRVRYRFIDPLGIMRDGLSRSLAPEAAAEWRPGDRVLIEFDRRRPDESVWLGRPVLEAVPAATPAEAAAARPRSRLRRTLGGVLRWTAMLGLVLAALGLGETLEPLERAWDWLEQERISLLIVAGGTTVLGFLLFMGGILDLIMSAGEAMAHEEVEDLYRSSRDIAARPYALRNSTYRIRGVASGASVQDEFSLREFKAALRSGALMRAGFWRRRAITALGGLMTVFGGFGLVIVLAPGGLKLLFAGALLYALVRLSCGFARA